MSLQKFAFSLALVLLPIGTGVLGQVNPPDPTPAISASPTVDGGMDWYNPESWGVEGRAWTRGLARYYDRLPARAEKIVPHDVWQYSRDSSGMNVRFITDSPQISIRYTLLLPNLSIGFADCSNVAVSGIDLYAQTTDPATKAEVWRWVAGNKPTNQKETDSLANGLAPGKRTYLLNLPLYNGIESIEIGVKSGSSFTGIAPRTDLPIVFYGTSIMQGGMASRPGLSMSALIGRRLDCPVIDLGFCGSGRMEAEVGAFLTEIPAAIYVIDCEPNMDANMVSQRTEPLVHQLRQAHPDTPILLVENHDYPVPKDVLPEENLLIESKQKALRTAFDNLINAGDKHLYYLPGHDLIGDDGEGTGDGVHPNALGTFRYAAAYTKELNYILTHDKSPMNP
jgi:hypothetical protein